ncbi:type II toxin-antitoxin system VapC family toxin [Methylobacterium sp. Leaf399]|uniref:type II toxin-antitoxin system VapC family toxin n=1 Tax=Methylobacterium sp. Leaf399 TaxID=1736364 RepID=UPI001FCD7A3C|nr:type II toxin-antitoxin system VapC family toxin [Methylobacterium sp. Leaf399]
MGLRPIPIGEAESELAIEAYARFGKGRHPAALDRGDCHAHACAKAHRAALPFEGDDFSKTDLPHPRAP